MQPMEEAISSNNCKKPMACFTGWFTQLRLFQLITEGNVIVHFFYVLSCTNLCSLVEPGTFFQRHFSTWKIHTPVSPILEEVHLVILCRHKFKSQVTRHRCKSLSQGIDPAGWPPGRHISMQPYSSCGWKCLSWGIFYVTMIFSRLKNPKIVD